MFVGALPKDCVAQIARVFPADRFDDLYVCCSGSFRLEQALRQVAPNARIHSNDVSLVSSALGTLAATGGCFPFEFVEDLAFAQPMMAGAGALHRVAALLVAGQIGGYTGSSEHSAVHRKHYRDNFLSYVDDAAERVAGLLEHIQIQDFACGDFRAHAARAVGKNAAVIGFPPTRKGEYESLHRFLHRNVRWEQPAYDVWDPKNLEGWTQSLRSDGVAFCVATDRELEGLEPVGAHYAASRKAIYLFADVPQSSVVRELHKAKAFRYTTVNPADLNKRSKVDLVPIGAQEISYLKDRYLAKGIAHSTGGLNFLVYVDGKLAGGFIYTKAKRDPDKTLYLLSDFSVSRERRLSKLIAMMASSKAPVNLAERRLMIRVEDVVTTAFTDKPVSMKYRGIFELAKRGEGYLQYHSKVRQLSPQEVYSEWFAKHAARG